MFEERRLKVPQYSENATWTYSNPVWEISRQFGYQDIRNFRQGVSCPSWASKIRSGADATTSFEAQRETLTGTLTSSHFMERFKVGGQWTPFNIQEYENWYNPVRVSLSGLSESSADNLALRKGFNALRKQRSHFQGMIFLGEAGESIGMIRDRGQKLFLGLTNYLSYLKGSALRARFSRGGKVNQFRLRQYLADTWLEYSFGWRPLISDINDAAKAYRQLINQTDNRRERIMVMGNVPMDTFDYGTDITSVGNVVFYEHGFARRGCSIRYIIFLKYSASGANPDISAMERFGFTLNDFIPAVWELTPWSFLVDYFTNIGDILNAVTTSQSDVQFVVRTAIKYGISEKTTHLDTRTMNQWYGDKNRYEWSGSPGHTFYTIRTVSRSSQGNLRYPSFEVSVPIRTTQWLNMAALSQQLNGVQGTLRRRFSILGG